MSYVLYSYVSTESLLQLIILINIIPFHVINNCLTQFFSYFHDLEKNNILAKSVIRCSENAYSDRAKFTFVFHILRKGCQVFYIILALLLSCMYGCLLEGE